MRSSGVTYDWELQNHLDLKKALDYPGELIVQLKLMGSDGEWFSHINLYPGYMKLDEETQKHYNPDLLIAKPAPYDTTVRYIGFFVRGVLKEIVNVSETPVSEGSMVTFKPGDLTVG